MWCFLKMSKLNAILFSRFIACARVTHMHMSHTQRTVHDPGAEQVHEELARQTAGDVAGGALPRSGEAARPALR